MWIFYSNVKIIEKILKKQVMQINKFNIYNIKTNIRYEKDNTRN